jgi:hypothetical protein
MRQQIDRLEAAMKAEPAVIELPLQHYHAQGIYGRRLLIPKGTAYVGKIHRFSHLRVVMKGRLLIVTDEGRYECVAPHVMVTPAGARRVGYALEDCEVMTFHATELSDPDEIEKEIIMPREEQLQEEQRLLGEIT